MLTVTADRLKIGQVTPPHRIKGGLGTQQHLPADSSPFSHQAHAIEQLLALLNFSLQKLVFGLDLVDRLAGRDDLAAHIGVGHRQPLDLLGGIHLGQKGARGDLVGVGHHLLQQHRLLGGMHHHIGQLEQLGYGGIFRVTGEGPHCWPPGGRLNCSSVEVVDDPPGTTTQHAPQAASWQHDANSVGKQGDAGQKGPGKTKARQHQSKEQHRPKGG